MPTCLLGEGGGFDDIIFGASTELSGSWGPLFCEPLELFDGFAKGGATLVPYVARFSHRLTTPGRLHDLQCLQKNTLRATFSLALAAFASFLSA